MTVTRLRAIFEKNDTQMLRRPAPKSAPRRVIVHASQTFSFHMSTRKKSFYAEMDKKIMLEDYFLLL